MSKLSDQINALPNELRSYIHDLETRADPAGDVATAHFAKEHNELLSLRVAELQSRIDAALSELDDFECGYNFSPEELHVIQKIRAPLTGE